MCYAKVIQKKEESEEKKNIYIKMDTKVFEIFKTMGT
jgi:hypothetical protein